MRAVFLALLGVGAAWSLPYDVDNSPLQQNLEYLESQGRKNASTLAQLQLSTTGVTSVTASSPLSSSGGTTPDISFTGTLAQSQITDLVADLGDKAAKGANGDITSMTALASVTSVVTFVSTVVVKGTVTVAGGGMSVGGPSTATYFYGDGSGLTNVNQGVFASSGTNADLTRFQNPLAFDANATHTSSITAISTTVAVGTVTVGGVITFPDNAQINGTGFHRNTQDANSAPTASRELRIEAQHAKTAVGSSIVIESGTSGGGGTNRGGGLFFVAGAGSNAAGGALVFKAGDTSSCAITETSSATFMGGRADGKGQGGAFALSSAIPTGDCAVNIGGGGVTFTGGYGSGNQAGGSITLQSGVGGPSSGAGGSVSVLASTGGVNGSVFIGGASQSTFTVNGTLNMGAPFNLKTKTLAELKTIVPAVGDVYRCSDCLVPYSIAEATGTNAGNFGIFAPGAFQ